ncbi:hypothetical protein [Longirhabdus pacifica]|uniref:hypothetical protein n=1 Tax=Longirhabdus pacifica TaxID=2305227 RepID=UPI001008EA13|nr:hypothetical protein [Longirhabdus pacifica]
MDKDIKLYVKNGDKEMSLELAEVDEYQKLILIEHVFSIFGVDTELLKSYQEVEKIYKMFYQDMKPTEDKPSVKGKTKNIDEVRHNMIQSYMEASAEIEKVGEKPSNNNNFSSIQKNQDHALRSDIDKGIRQINGLPHYQLFYACPNEKCRMERKHKGKQFVPLSTKTVTCSSCNTEMEVSPAHPDGFPKRDTFGNYFVSGLFKDVQLDWPELKI